MRNGAHALGHMAENPTTARTLYGPMPGEEVGPSTDELGDSSPGGRPWAMQLRQSGVGYLLLTIHSDSALVRYACRMADTGARTPLIERLLRRIQVEDDGCWRWIGARKSDGYGQIREGGKHGARLLTHRVAYQHFVGPIADGLEIDHLCRNRACCNPEHLEAVTHKVNMARGEMYNGVKTHCKWGHEFTQENTKISSDGRRVCVQCLRARAQRYNKGGAVGRPRLTVCQRGHEMVGDNIYVDKNSGRRHCLACIRLRSSYAWRKARDERRA